MKYLAVVSGLTVCLMASRVAGACPETLTATSNNQILYATCDTGSVTSLSGVANYNLFLKPTTGVVVFTQYTKDPQALLRIYSEVPAEVFLDYVQLDGYVSTGQLMIGMYAFGDNYWFQGYPSAGKTLRISYTSGVSKPSGWTIKYSAYFICPDGFYGGTPLNMLTCEPCKLGFAGPIYNPSRSNGDYQGNGCTVCQSGTYSSAVGQSRCTQCVPGTYSPSNAYGIVTTCTLCAANSFSTASGMAAVFYLVTQIAGVPKVTFYDHPVCPACDGAPEGASTCNATCVQNQTWGWYGTYPCKECTQCSVGMIATSSCNIQSDTVCQNITTSPAPLSTTSTPPPVPLTTPPPLLQGCDYYPSISGFFLPVPNGCTSGSVTWSGSASLTGGTSLFTLTGLSAGMRITGPTSIYVPLYNEWSLSLADNTDSTVMRMTVSQSGASVYAGATFQYYGNTMTCPLQGGPFSVTQYNYNTAFAPPVYWDTPVVCTVCPGGQYVSSPCTFSTQTVCSPCSSCGAGEYTTAACTTTSNTVCTRCTTCGAGGYAKYACGATVDATCATCRTCGTGDTPIYACNQTSDTVCPKCFETIVMQYGNTVNPNCTEGNVTFVTDPTYQYAQQFVLRGRLYIMISDFGKDPTGHFYIKIAGWDTFVFSVVDGGTLVMQEYSDYAPYFGNIISATNTFSFPVTYPLDPSYYGWYQGVGSWTIQFSASSIPGSYNRSYTKPVTTTTTPAPSTTTPVPTTSIAPTTTPRPSLPQCTQNIVISTFGQVVPATCANGVVTYPFRWVGAWPFWRVTGIPPNSNVTIGTPFNWLDSTLYLFYPGQYEQYLVDNSFTGKYMGYFVSSGSYTKFYDMTLKTDLVVTSYLMATGGDMLYGGAGNGYPIVILWGNASMPTITTPPPTTSTTPPAVTQAWPNCPQDIVVTQANYRSIFNSNPPCKQGSITTQYVERPYLSKYGWGFGPILQGTLITVYGYTQDPDGSIYAGPVYSTGMGNDVHQTVVSHMFDRYSIASWACTTPECWVNYYPGGSGQATGLTLSWGSSCDCALGYYITGTCYDVLLARCTICPANFFCEFVSGPPMACPLGSVSPMGSSSVLNCGCPAGTWGEVNSTTAVCSQCSANMFCTGAICSPTQCGICANCSRTAASACPNHTWSAPSASSILNCSCVAGAFAPGVGMACDFCGVGKYTSGLGMTTCQNCNYGTYLTGMGMPSAGSCHLCDTGTYNSVPGASVCSSCAAGTYTSADGAPSLTACLFCPMGTFSVTPAVCHFCDPGTYNTGIGSSGCTTCAAGTYNYASGSAFGSPCISCPVGTYSLTLGADSGSYCLACWVGFYCLTVATSPQPCTGLSVNAVWTTTGTLPGNCGFLCNPSYYVPNGSPTECRACPANSWCISNLNHSCPVDYHSPALSFDQSQCYVCTLCNLGTFQTSNCSMFNNTGCDLCKSALMLGSCWQVHAQQCSTGQCSTCTNCSQTVPSTCPNNTGSLSNATTLNNCFCNAGAFVATANSGLACALCGTGTYASSTGMTSCQTCSTGTYLTGSGMQSATNCLSCAAGSYNAALGVSACTLCGNGTFSASTGASVASVCTSCSQGYYSTALGANSGTTCLLVDKGFYSLTVGMAPQACTGLPLNAVWTTSGTLPGNCGWSCNPSYYLVNVLATTCTPCTANYWCTSNKNYSCPSNSYSPALSSDQSQCMCSSGFYGNASSLVPCSPCMAGFYCPGNNNNSTLLCPGNSSSPYGSSLITQCQCLPGFYGNNGSTCSLCPPNTICLSGQLNNCTANSQAGTGNAGLCSCNAGYYSSVLGGTCSICPANMYCTGGTNITNCTANAVTTSTGSASSLFCYCGPGYQGQQNAACVACIGGTFCNLGVPGSCPTSSTSPPLSSAITSCTCNAGYTGSNGGTCSACNPGAYKSSSGSSPCTGCAVNTFAPSSASAFCTATTNCAGGYWANPVYTTTTDNTCQICPAGSQCQSNSKTICPSVTTSPIGSSTYLNCTCPSGMFGIVSGPLTATCTACTSGMFCPGTVCRCSA